LDFFSPSHISGPEKSGKLKNSQAPVAHTCNPSYSGGRNQEDHGLMAAWANSLPDPILKKTHHKIWLVSWLKLKALSSSPNTTKKKRKKTQ
jgi:hypothetical protein